MEDASIPVKKLKFIKEPWVKRYVKTMDKSLSITATSAFVFSLLYKVLLMRWEAPCQTIYHLGDWTFILSMSILAAAIFHFFTVHYTLIKDRERYADIVDMSVCSLITKTNSYIKDSIELNYVALRFSSDVPTENEWEEMKKYDNSNIPINWLENCSIIINNTKKEFEILSNFKKEYKDIFMIVSKLYSTSLLRSEEALKDALKNKRECSFSMLDPLLYEYLQEMKPLYNFYNEIITKSLNNYKVEY